MQAKEVVQKGNTLNVSLEFNPTCGSTLYSSQYVIRDSIAFQVRIITSSASRCSNNSGSGNSTPNNTLGGYQNLSICQRSSNRLAIIDPVTGRQVPSAFNSGINVYDYAMNNTVALNNLVFIKLVKCHKVDKLNYTIKFTSHKLGVSDMCFASDEGHWHLVNELVSKQNESCTIDIAVQMDVIPSVSSFSPLHEDTDLLDFELRGEDGSVMFHRNVLAAASPVFKTMLGATWQEAKEGRVDVPGTSKKTLQFFKNYIYLRTLPNEDIEHLLLLSLYYMMPELEQRCVHKLMDGLTAKNACDLFMFAGKNEVTSLLLAILDCMETRSVDIKEMRKHFLFGKR